MSDVPDVPQAEVVLSADIRQKEAAHPRHVPANS